MRNKIELLAPAGDITKGKTALDFGADAIYFGGKMFSLRAKASNYTINDIEEISNYAHDKNKKVYLVTNILCQNHMIDGFEEFINSVSKNNIDAFICADPYIIWKHKQINKDAKIHISTQQSVANSKACLFFKKNGATRIILARETTFDETRELIKNVHGEIEIETFIHGAVCIAYSGRCSLSSNYCLRDSNVGGCAQCCRWTYSLSDKEKEYTKNFSISAKDMCLISKIKDLIDIGICSGKIEGRMKSEYYIATVVNDYRNVIDAIYDNKSYDFYVNDVEKAANRETGLAWFDGIPGTDKMLYNEIQKIVKQTFAFVIVKKINDKEYIVITKNNIKLSNTYEIINKKTHNIFPIKIKQIINDDGISVDVIPTPMSRATIILENDYDLDIGDIGRITNI